MTPNHGEAETHFYDKQSNLLVKAKKTQLSSHMPSVQSEFTFSEYQRVDGLLLPHRIKRTFEQCGSKRELLFVAKSIEHNVDLPADRFEPPKNVQAIAVLEKGGVAIKKVLFGDSGSSSKPARPPCGKKSSAASSESDTGKRKPCGGG